MEPCKTALGWILHLDQDLDQDDAVGWMIWGFPAGLADISWH
jgi:hypothetical protein